MVGGHSWLGEALRDRLGDSELEGGKEGETPEEEKPGGQSQDAQMKTSDAIRWERGPGTEVGQRGRARVGAILQLSVWSSGG